MVTTRQSSMLVTNILSEGLHLSARNRALFSLVLVLAVANASASFSLLTYSITSSPFTTKIIKEFGARQNYQRIRRTPKSSCSGSSEHANLVIYMRINLWELLLVITVIGSVVWIIAVFAAVAVCSGRTPQTLRKILHKGCMGPLMAAALANVAANACLVIIMALALALNLATVLLQEWLPALVFLDMLFICAAYAAYRYLDFVCSVGVVVAAAEPGCHGLMVTLRRAWLLTSMELAEAVSFVLGKQAAAGSISPFFVIAAACAAASMGWRALLGLVYVLLSGAVQVVSVCAAAVFYYECRLRCIEGASISA